MRRYSEILDQCRRFRKLAIEKHAEAKKEPRHLGYMVDGDWSIAEEPDGSFSATHLNGKGLTHRDLKMLKRMVMRHSGFEELGPGKWKKLL
jgi:undecaprenyl pyrophosphate synthase